jgi:hypothetical protein
LIFTISDGVHGRFVIAGGDAVHESKVRNASKVIVEVEEASVFLEGPTRIMESNRIRRNQRLGAAGVDDAHQGSRVLVVAVQDKVDVQVGFHLLVEQDMVGRGVDGGKADFGSILDVHDIKGFVASRFTKRFKKAVIVTGHKTNFPACRRRRRRHGGTALLTKVGSLVIDYGTGRVLGSNVRIKGEQSRLSILCHELGFEIAGTTITTVRVLRVLPVFNGGWRNDAVSGGYTTPVLTLDKAMVDKVRRAGSRRRLGTGRRPRGGRSRSGSRNGTAARTAFAVTTAVVSQGTPEEGRDDSSRFLVRVGHGGLGGDG